jgi:mannose-6-phosphate isomerase
MVDLPQPIGELWLSGEGAKFENGPWGGKSLGEVWRDLPNEILGSDVLREKYFPLLTKFLFPRDKLSIQVHPDDDYARQRENEPGKTEMWYIVEAEQDAFLLLGLKPGVDEKVLRAAITSGTAEEYLRRIPVRGGDAFFIPPGTVHSIGPGMTICEIEEYSDLTYRLYDFGRVEDSGKPRELHIEKAFEVIGWATAAGPVGGRLSPFVYSRKHLVETFVVACRYFAVETWEFDQPVGAATRTRRFDLLIFLHGQGRIEHGTNAFEYRPGEAWLIPAALGYFRLQPAGPSKLIRTFVPDLARDWIEPLRERGATEADWSRMTFF